MKSYTLLITPKKLRTMELRRFNTLNRFLKVTGKVIVERYSQLVRCDVIDARRIDYIDRLITKEDRPSMLKRYVRSKASIVKRIQHRMKVVDRFGEAILKLDEYRTTLEIYKNVRHRLHRTLKDEKKFEHFNRHITEEDSGSNIIKKQRLKKYEKQLRFLKIEVAYLESRLTRII